MRTDSAPTERPLVTTRLDSPIGALTLFGTHEALVGLYFEQHRPAPRLSGRPGASPALDQARADLEAYFRDPSQGPRVVLAAHGTELERAVWRQLAKIPLGQTRTYGEIAAALGRPRAARAVGSAVARNPLSILVPCHRVVGARGALTGFAGGLERKAWLLAHEGVAL